MRHRYTLILVLLLAASCTGPRSPVDVGVKEIDTDILIGPVPPRVVAVPPPASPPRSVGFPGFVQPPFVPTPPPAPSPSACPKADPLAPVRHDLTTRAEKPPVEAAYRYRNIGTWVVGDRRGVFPSSAVWTISNVKNPADGGGFSFDVSIPDPAGPVTTTTYHVYPTQPNALSPTPGLYIEQIVTRQGGEPVATFAPVPSIMLMQFPAARDLSWTTRGVDPRTQTLMQFDARISRDGIIDACGTKLAAWVIDVSNGTFRSATTEVTFSSTIAIAPQFGGLVLLHELSERGTTSESPAASPVPFEVDNKATIAVAPRFPS